ncbi:MAG TPA: aspartate kinase [Pseudobdellovibrionaceae bacterium]|nr:aspartate kinase [Pseudobdellovibrionaceae bacterium]
MAENSKNKLIVKKYGGMTLSDPEKIKSVAADLAENYNNGFDLIVVVSAMGKTTDSLIELAQKITINPNPRELDMLLTVGERISMSLLSMALIDLGIPAISLTGSQAGILTTNSHSNAMITDIQSPRITAALKEKKVVIVAGFQGVCPLNKEITTLGRGGSDTTAVAIASRFKALRCEILKEVPSVFSADPSLLPQAKPLHDLKYDELLDMTFWGAKVLHYRSVELASIKKVSLSVGPAHFKNQNLQNKPTQINTSNHMLLTQELSEKDNSKMFESQKILSINGHKKIICIKSTSKDSAQALQNFLDHLEKNQIAAPQVLHINDSGINIEIYFTSSSEILTFIENAPKTEDFMILNNNLSSVTTTVTGNSSPYVALHLLNALKKNHLTVHKVLFSALSLTVFINANDYIQTLEICHNGLA